jgi:Ca2+-binding EF-hand superfamily protein
LLVCSRLLFKALDIDGNGQLSFYEFMIASDTMTASSSSKKKLEFIFKVYDIDGNGYIDKNEMLNILVAITDFHSNGNSTDQQEMKNKVDSIFFRMDKNSDGKPEILNIYYIKFYQIIVVLYLKARFHSKNFLAVV